MLIELISAFLRRKALTAICVALITSGAAIIAQDNLILVLINEGMQICGFEPIRGAAESLLQVLVIKILGAAMIVFSVLLFLWYDKKGRPRRALSVYFQPDRNFILSGNRENGVYGHYEKYSAGESFHLELVGTISACGCQVELLDFEATYSVKGPHLLQLEPELKLEGKIQEFSGACGLTRAYSIKCGKSIPFVYVRKMGTDRQQRQSPADCQEGEVTVIVKHRFSDETEVQKDIYRLRLMKNGDLVQLEVEQKRPRDTVAIS